MRVWGVGEREGERVLAEGGDRSRGVGRVEGSVVDATEYGGQELTVREVHRSWDIFSTRR